MKLSEIIENHKGSFCILVPNERGENNQVIEWKVVDTATTIDDAEKLFTLYSEEGLAGVVIFDTNESEDESMAGIWARFYRVFFGM